MCVQFQVSRKWIPFTTVKSSPLTKEELEVLKSQTVISSAGNSGGARRATPYAFTEQGVVMLSSVLSRSSGCLGKHRDHAGLRAPAADVGLAR